MGVLDIYGFEIFEVRDLVWDFDTCSHFTVYAKGGFQAEQTHTPNTIFGC